MTTRYDPKDPQRFLRMGRFDPAEQTCALWWSGSGFRTRIDCTRLELEAEVKGAGRRPGWRYSWTARRWRGCR